MRLITVTLFSSLWLAAAALAADAPDGWPRWRGPNEDGMARGDAPLTWSDKEHVAWKSEIPGRGHSSPVVWGDRIFLTTAVPTGSGPAPTSAPAGRGLTTGPLGEHSLLVLAFDRKTGKRLWEKTARVVTPHEGYHPQYGSNASNSMVVDAQHAFAFFGSNGVYCYTHDGKLVWQKDFGVKLEMFRGFGEGISPVLDGDKLILLFDHEGDSFLVALDKSTGRELWRTPRAPGTTWSSPLIVRVGDRKQILISATKFAAGYDLETGKEIWRATGLGRNTIPMPVVHDGVVIMMSGYQSPNLLAIQLGREGDLTGTDAILWQNQRGNSYTPSPVVHEGKLYVLTNDGMLSCFDVKTGRPFYLQQRLPKPYSLKASLVGANGKLYIATEDGDVVVARMGEKYETLATNSLRDQVFIATPAIANGEIYLRGQNTLFCIR